MQESARIAATIELLETIFTSRAPADALLGSYYRARRYIGAKDKGYISELVYFTLRHFAVLEWWMAWKRHSHGTAWKARCTQ